MKKTLLSPFILLSISVSATRTEKYPAMIATDAIIEAVTCPVKESTRLALITEENSFGSYPNIFKMLGQDNDQTSAVYLHGPTKDLMTALDDPEHFIYYESVRYHDDQSHAHQVLSARTMIRGVTEIAGEPSKALLVPFNGQADVASNTPYIEAVKMLEADTRWSVEVHTHDTTPVLTCNTVYIDENKKSVHVVQTRVKADDVCALLWTDIDEAEKAVGNFPADLLKASGVKGSTLIASAFQRNTFGAVDEAPEALAERLPGYTFIEARLTRNRGRDTHALVNPFAFYIIRHDPDKGQTVFVTRQNTMFTAHDPLGSTWQAAVTALNPKVHADALPV